MGRKQVRCQPLRRWRYFLVVSAAQTKHRRLNDLRIVLVAIAVAAPSCKWLGLASYVFFVCDATSIISMSARKELGYDTFGFTVFFFVCTSRMCSKTLGIIYTGLLCPFPAGRVWLHPESCCLDALK